MYVCVCMCVLIYACVCLCVVCVCQIFMKMLYKNVYVCHDLALRDMLHTLFTQSV